MSACDACDKVVMHDDDVLMHDNVPMHDDAQENKAKGYCIFGV